jgi:hypothetical protein
MNALVDFLREGGWWMYPVLAPGASVIPVAAMATMFKHRFIAFAATMDLALCVGLGIAGMLSGRRMTEQALAMVNPEDAAMIRAAGYAESMRPLQLAGIIAIVVLPLVLAAIARSRRAA